MIMIFGRTFTSESELKAWMMDRTTVRAAETVLESCNCRAQDARKLVALVYLTSEWSADMFPLDADVSIKRTVERTAHVFRTADSTPTSRRLAFEKYLNAYDAWLKRDEDEMLRHLVSAAVSGEDPPDEELTRSIVHLGGLRTMALVDLFRSNRAQIFERVAEDVERVCTRAYFDVMREECAAGNYVRLFSYLKSCRDTLKTKLSASDVDEYLDVEWLESRQQSGTLDTSSLRKSMLQVLDLVRSTHARLRAAVEVDPLTNVVDWCIHVADCMNRLE